MLRIRPAQMETLHKALCKNFEADLARQLEAYAVSERRALVHLAVKDAGTHGFLVEEEIRRFAALLLRHGAEFLQRRDVQDILSDPALPPTQKLEHLESLSLG